MISNYKMIKYSSHTVSHTLIVNF